MPLPATAGDLAVAALGWRAFAAAFLQLWGAIEARPASVFIVLSLVFGGLLWPLAWLWAYSKPVLYRMAYGTDQVEHGGGGHSQPAQPPKLPDEDTKVTAVEADDVRSLRARIAELEARLAGTAATAGRAGEGAKA